jgi:DNA methylase
LQVVQKKKLVIEMASNEGDVVLDPFVGGGTTVAVANQLNRQWIGIDQSVQAVKITELRLWNLMDLFSKPFVTQLHKYDYDTLRYQDAFEFEHFMVHHFGGVPNVKQRGEIIFPFKSNEVMALGGMWWIIFMPRFNAPINGYTIGKKPQIKLQVTSLRLVLDAVPLKKWLG